MGFLLDTRAPMHADSPAPKIGIVGVLLMIFCTYGLVFEVFILGVADFEMECGVFTNLYFFLH